MREGGGRRREKGEGGRREEKGEGRRREKGGGGRREKREEKEIFLWKELSESEVLCQVHEVNLLVQLPLWLPW